MCVCVCGSGGLDRGVSVYLNEVTENVRRSGLDVCVCTCAHVCVCVFVGRHRLLPHDVSGVEIGQAGVGAHGGVGDR